MTRRTASLGPDAPIMPRPDPTMGPGAFGYAADGGGEGRSEVVMRAAPRGHDAPRSRRALLIGTVAAVGAGIASVVGRAVPGAAADGDPALLGRSNETTGTTRVTRTTNGPALIADAAPSGTALTGAASDGVGVQAIADRGLAISAMAVEGVAVDARSFGGDAIRVRHGRVRLGGLSGLVTIREGEERVVVSPWVPFRAGSILLLSPRSDLGGRDLWYELDGEERQYAIRVSAPATVRIDVGWVLLN